MKAALGTFGPGFLAGAGLAIAGMTNPAKVLGFLDFSGAWDPSLALVMGGALAAFMVGARLAQRRPRPIMGGSFPGAPPHKVEKRTIGGALLFGAGWGLVGFCPGPAIANLGALRYEALVFVPAMLVGMWIARAAFGLDRPEASAAPTPAGRG